MAAIDLEATGLLDGLEGDARAERVELLEWLFDRGFTVQQLRAAFAPMLMPARRLLGDDGTYVSAREISEKHQIDLEMVQRIQRAAGLTTVDDPDARVHLRADGEAIAAGVQPFIEAGFTAEQIVSVVRVLADGLSHAAEVMRYTALATVMRPHATELEIAKSVESMVAGVVPLLGPMVQDMLFLQLRHLMETEAVNATERAAGSALPGAREVTVAFADLVGFTRLGEAVPPEDLEQLARALADLARDVAVAPVRLIKTIGDAVMLVSSDAVALLNAMLDLVDAAEESQLPQLRVGVASGAAVSRAGDWFGSPVNVASRVTGVARPGAVLVAESTYDAIGENDRFRWSFASARHLKGIRGETKLYRARRVADD